MRWNRFLQLSSGENNDYTCNQKVLFRLLAQKLNDLDVEYCSLWEELGCHRRKIAKRGNHRLGGRMCFRGEAGEVNYARLNNPEASERVC